jgi:hypothetical protein
MTDSSCGRLRTETKARQGKIIEHCCIYTADDIMGILPLELTLIVAATRDMGIGLNGTLPWTGLKKEMAYFARVTKRLPSQVSSYSRVRAPSRHVLVLIVSSCCPNIGAATSPQCSHHGTQDMGQHPASVPSFERATQCCHQPLFCRISSDRAYKRSGHRACPGWVS